MRLELEQPQSKTIFPIEHAPVSDPSNAEEAAAFLREGIKLAQSGDRSRARMSLIKASELDPRSESVWLWLSSISEYPEELLAFLTKVLEINPENARALEWSAATKGLMAKNLVQRGRDAVDSGQAGMAAELFEEALELDPANIEARLSLASAAETEADKIRHFEQVLQFDPENETAASGITAAKAAIRERVIDDAKALALNGDVEKANSLLDGLLTEQPDAEELWVLRAHFAPELHARYASFLRVLEINPENPVAQATIESLSWIASAEEGTQEVPGDEHEAEMISSFSETDETEAEAGAELGLVETYSEDEQAYEDHDEQPPAISAWAETAGIDDDPSAAFDEGEADFEEISYELASEQPNFDAEAEMLADADWSESDPSHHLEAEPEETEDAAAAPVPFPAASPFSAVSADDPADEFKTLVSIELDDEMRAAIDSYGPVDSAGSAGHNSPFDAPFDVTMLTGQIPMPGHELEGEVPGSTTGFETNVVTSTADDAQNMSANAACPFCRHHNDHQSISCSNCLAVLTLADLELILGNHNADKSLLREAVEGLERERSTRELSEYELTMLGIGHLNLRNLQYGFNFLQEASHSNPNNVVLAGQVNALLIRLEEIKLQAEAHEAMSRGKKILVVDDSPTVRKLIAGKLEKCGHEVYCSSDGVEAMEQISQVQPDLVLLDITMPRMDGYQVCKMIRSNDKTKDVPVVMISGKDGFFDKVRGRMAGSSGYITKPFGPETLMKAVESYLRGDFQES